MQHEECNEAISSQDMRAKGGVTEIISLVSCYR